MPPVRSLAAAPARPAALAFVASVAPGIGLATLVAAAALAIGLVLPDAISEIAIALLIGLLVGNALPVRARAAAGTRFAVHRLLRAGIILLGARLALDEVLRTGSATLLFVAVTVTAVLVVGGLLAARSERPVLAFLIAVGTAICGNSAIIAVAPTLDAEERDVSFAVATITGFGVLAVLLYPVIGHLVGLTSGQFGVWAGAAVNDTSQVVAAGYAFDPVAGDTAVVTKLTRNLLLAPALVAIALLANRRQRGGADGAGPAGATSPVDAVRRAVPLFVVGFALMAAARSLGWLDVPLAGRPAFEVASAAANGAILVALAAVGLQTDVRAIRAAGLRPLGFGLALAAALAAGSLVAILALRLGA